MHLLIHLFALFSQELKQDISSFRYEVMGMMKTGKPALPGAKASSSSSSSSSADSGSSLEVPPCPQSGQVKSKLNRFKLIASILKQGSSTASPRPPESSNGLPNGLLSPVSDEGSGEKSSQRKNFPKDITDFGLFQKRHKSGNEDASGAGQMYSLSEEAADSDADGQDKEHGARGKDERGRLETEGEGDAAASENREVLDPNSSSDEGGKKESKVKDKESLPCGDSVADGCMSGSPGKEA